MINGRIEIELPRALKEEFKLYCKEQHISFDQKVKELLKNTLSMRKAA